MTVHRYIFFALPLMLAACKDQAEPEVEIQIDEEKLGRAIGRLFVIESEKIATEMIIMDQPALDMTLPPPSPEQGAGKSETELKITLEISENGNLYGLNEMERTLLADEAAWDNLEEAKEWIQSLNVEPEKLAVAVTADESQAHQKVMELIDLLRRLKISKVTFSGLTD